MKKKEEKNEELLSLIKEIVLETEKRVTKDIQKDIDFGSGIDRIMKNIKRGYYTGNPIESFKTFEKIKQALNIR